MLMVIFGAGASKDSIAPGDWANRSFLDYQPPLANELFDVGRTFFGHTLELYYESRVIIPRMRRAVSEGRGVEEELAVIREEPHPAHPAALTAVRFYLRRILRECSIQWPRTSHGITNYLEFLYQIEGWRSERPGEEVLLVTFNYDTLLEQGLESLFTGCRFDRLESYVAMDHPYKVFKPHGSVTWSVRARNRIRSGEQQDIEHQVIGLGNEVRLTEDYHVDERASIVSDDRPDEFHALVPAIAIPLQRKTEFLCPPTHVEMLTSSLPDVTELLVVGWRGTEENFLTLLRENRPNDLRRLWAVCGTRHHSEDSLTRLQDAVKGAAEAVAYDVDFSRFVAEKHIEGMLP